MIPLIQIPLAKIAGLDLTAIPVVLLSCIRFLALSFLFHVIKQLFLTRTCTYLGVNRLTTLSTQWTADNIQLICVITCLGGIIISTKEGTWTTDEKAGTGLVVSVISIILATVVNIGE